MAANPDTLKNISNERIAFLTEEAERFNRSISAVADELRARTIDAMGDLSLANATRAKALVDLQRELQRQLNRLDYDGKVGDFIGQYDASQTFAIQTLDSMGIAVKRLAPLDTKALEALKRHDYTFLTELGRNTIQQVATGVVQNTLMGTPRSRIIDNIRATLDTRLKNQAVTYADTALVSYDRRTAYATWKAAGIKRYLYRGPQDIKNREFCEHHVGRIYTVPEIEALDQELARYSKKPLLPCLYYGGGWNCRHVWTPVMEDAEPAKPKPEKSKSPTPPTPRKPLVGPGGEPYVKGEEIRNRLKNLIIDPNEKLQADYRAAQFEHGRLQRQLAAIDQTDPFTRGEVQSLRFDIRDVQARIEALDKAMIEDAAEQARSILYAPKPAKFKKAERSTRAKIYSQVKQTLVKPRKISDRSRAVISKGIEGFSKLVGAGHAVEGKTIEFFNDPSDPRSYHHPGVGIMMGDSAPAKTVVHELGHWYEMHDKAARVQVEEFLKRRTTLPDGTREPVQKLSALTGNPGYKDHEVTRPDKFIHPYIGKVYPDASEVVSMGLEFMYDDPRKFAAQDPDMFDFIWDLMRAPRP